MKTYCESFKTFPVKVSIYLKSTYTKSIHVFMLECFSYFTLSQNLFQCFLIYRE